MADDESPKKPRNRPPDITIESSLNPNTKPFKSPQNASAGNGTVTPDAGSATNHSEQAAETLKSPTNLSPPPRESNNEQVTSPAQSPPLKTPRTPGHWKHQPPGPGTPTVANENEKEKHSDALLAKTKKEAEDRDTADYERIRKAQEDVEYYKKKWDEAEQARRKLQAEVRSNEQQVRASADKITELEGQIKKEQTAVKAVNEKLEDSKGMVSELKKQLAGAMNDLEEAEERIEADEQELTDLRFTINGYEQTELPELERSRENWAKMVDENEEVKEELEKVTKAFEDTFSDLSKGLSMDEYLRHMKITLAMDRSHRDPSQASSNRGSLGPPNPWAGRAPDARDRQVSTSSIGDELKGRGDSEVDEDEERDGDGEEEDEEGEEGKDGDEAEGVEGEPEAGDEDETLKEKQLFDELFGEGHEDLVPPPSQENEKPAPSTAEPAAAAPKGQEDVKPAPTSPAEGRYQSRIQARARPGTSLPTMSAAQRLLMRNKDTQTDDIDFKAGDELQEFEDELNQMEKELEQAEKERDQMEKERDFMDKERREALSRADNAQTLAKQRQESLDKLSPDLHKQAVKERALKDEIERLENRVEELSGKGVKLMQAESALKYWKNHDEQLQKICQERDATIAELQRTFAEKDGQQNLGFSGIESVSIDPNTKSGISSDPTTTSGPQIVHQPSEPQIFVMERVPWWFWYLFAVLAAIYALLLGGLMHDRAIWFSANDTMHLELVQRTSGYTGGWQDGSEVQRILMGWFGGDLSLWG